MHWCSNILPPEILDGIIQCFASRRTDGSGNWFHDSHESTVQMDKRQLGACSLVCRYWFQRCRPHIVGSLKIRSAQDLDDLLEMIRSLVISRFPLGSPVPGMAQVMNELIIVQSGAWSKPWLHDVTDRVFFNSLLLRPFLDIRLVVEDAYIPDSSSPTGPKHAPPSLSTYLPRSVPGTFFRFIDLDLSNLCFRRPLDLLRMVNDVPTLYRVSCTKITFTEDIEAPLPQRVWRPHPNLVLVNTFQCGGFGFEVRMLFMLLLSRVRRENETLGMLLDAGPAMQDIIASCPVSGGDVPMKITRRPCWIELVCFQDITGSPTHHIQYSVDGDPESPNPANDETCFVFTLCSQLKMEDVVSWNWTTIDDVLCTLHPRPCVEILTPDPNLFKWFLRGIQEESVLKRFSRFRNLDVHFVHGDKIVCSLGDVYSTQASYTVDDTTIELDVGQRFDLWKCPDGEKEAFLRLVLAKKITSEVPKTAPSV